MLLSHSLSLFSLYFHFSLPRVVQGGGTVGGMSVWPGGAGPPLNQDWCQCQYGRLCKLSVYQNEIGSLLLLFPRSYYHVYEVAVCTLPPT